MSYSLNDIFDRVENWLGEQDKEREPFPVHVLGDPAEAFILKGWKRCVSIGIGEVLSYLL